MSFHYGRFFTSRKMLFPLICNILFVFLASCCLTSCFTTIAALSAISRANQNNISRESSYLELRIIQTLAKGEALACTEKFEVVKIESLTEIYYDGKRVNGYFTLLDTYTYQTRNGVWKTVPVFVLNKEYRKNKELWEMIHSDNYDDDEDSTTLIKESFHRRANNRTGRAAFPCINKSFSSLQKEYCRSSLSREAPVHGFSLLCGSL